VVKLGKSAAFLLSFLALFFVPFALIHFLPLGFASEAVASVEETMLKAAGYATQRDGAFLSIGGKSDFEIVTDCTGLVMVILFFALLYSTPSKADKPRALLIYAPVLLSFNLARLFATLVAHYHFGPAVFEGVHVALWFVDSAVVLWCWSRATGAKLL